MRREGEDRGRKMGKVNRWWKGRSERVRDRVRKG